MKTYIVTITKALGKQTKVQVNANSKKEVVQKLSVDFGFGIAPINTKNVQLLSDLPTAEQSFF